MASTTVNFNLKTAGYANYANQTLTFTLLSAGAEASSGTQDYVVLPGTVTATSDANGDGSATLFRNGKSGINSVYEVVFPNRERAKFVIPSGSATIELAALIVDNVPSGAATQQSSVYAAAIQRANHTGTQALSTISDAGTIASQASNSVSISGGSISGVTLTASTANLTDATDKRLMTDAQEAKLDTVETNADVTDTANVTSAGALMDSELADLTGVKTITMPDSTVISDFAKTVLDDTSAAAVKTTLGITDATAQVNFVPRSISFTNTSAYLSLADAPELDVDAGDFSLSFWARLDSSGTEPVLNKLSGTGYRLRFVSGALILTMQDSGGSADFELATGLNDNKWHVYVVTVDRSGNAIAYVDNVAQTARDVSGTALTLANGGQFQIGSDGGSNAGDGIALGNYVALHKSALTSSQAGQIYFSADAALTAVAPELMVDLRKADKTFTDLSTNGFAVTTNGTIIFNEGRITSLNNVIINPTLPAAVTGSTITASDSLNSPTITAALGLGYGGSGTGGTFDQSTGSGTGKAKTVVLNKATGQITLDNASLAANASVAFTLTNSTIAAHDILVFNHVSGGTIGAYNFNAVASSGSAVVTVRNMTSGALTDAAVVSFAVIKAVTS
jgi:hypothetical protein